MNKYHRKKAFSLLELLIGLSLFSVVFLSSIALLSSGINNKLRMIDQFKDQYHTQAIFNIIENDISHANHIEWKHSQLKLTSLNATITYKCTNNQLFRLSKQNESILLSNRIDNFTTKLRKNYVFISLSINNGKKTINTRNHSKTILRRHDSTTQSTENNSDFNGI